MNKILDRYIVKSILLVTGYVILTMIGLIFFITLLGELKQLEGEYTLWQAMIYAVLRMPHDLYQFLPMMSLLGGIAGLGLLSSHRELIVMRASGFSVYQIAGAVLLASFILIFMVTMIGEWLAPSATYMAAVRKETAQNNGQAVITQSGLWIHENTNFYHIKQIVQRHRVEGISWYQFDNEHRMKSTYFAQWLEKVEGHWVAHDVVKTTFTKERVKSEHLDNEIWNLTLNSNLLNMGLVEANELSLSRLSKYIRYLTQNGLQANEYRYEFWQRIFQPLASLVMVLLAIPFVLTLRSSISIGWRLLGGVMVGFGFYISNAMLGQVSVAFQVPPWLAALVPTLLFAAISVVMLRRVGE